MDEDWKWATAIVRYGALDGADGLSVHLYNQCMRENRRTADELLTRLNDLQDKLKALRGGRYTPLYVTEFGWPTMETRCNVSPQRSAYNFAHYILQSATYPWLKGSWIYELKDEDVNPDDLEANFGVFNNGDSPKPAACFIKSAREIVANAKSVELRKLRPDAFAVRAVLADRQVVAVWSNDMSPSGKIRLDQQPVSAKAMCGAQVDNRGAIPISQVPLLLSYKLDQQISLTIEH